MTGFGGMFMKKSSFSLLVVVGILLITPLVGYFGTKYVVLWMKEAPARVETGVEEPSAGETGNPETTPEATTPAASDQGSSSAQSASEEAFLTLPGQSFTLIQLASLSTEEGARDFIEERDLEALVFEKDGLYKVVYGIFKDDGKIAAIQEKAREAVSDAFRTTGDLPEKKVFVTDLDASEAGAVSRDLEAYFSLMKAMDDYYAALLKGESVTGLAGQIADGIDPLLAQEALKGDPGSKLRAIYQDTRDLVTATEQSPEAFLRGYNQVMARVVLLYR